ncbi:hypothetical protein CTAYLR_003924 [Chrysophaeum taylorii]|uniref:DnaJ homolog subfamily C member 2 n=1 Tax=Chrysophaeum taylorii TaxID=2483200 RepID=A0AAD7UA74_9STRA|nr:hypothetical protein CTAYLR_003924 [Chrysophaeum taylorii]
MAIVVFGGITPVELEVAEAGRALVMRAEAKRAETQEPLTRNASSAALSSSGSGRDSEGPSSSSSSSNSSSSSSSSSRMATFRVREADLDRYNYYELLGLDSFGVGVDEEAIKRAYRAALLLYHPDKQQNPTSCKDDAVFLAVQKAFEVLGNEQSRRAFDSTNNFDEEIPTGKEATELGSKFDFYATYGPVFRSNARFAAKLPVPELGDETCDRAYVDRFYEYWFNFESWRDFGLEAAEHDVEMAEDRFEKRWMAKENDKLAKKRKKEEYARIVALVERARANDPRVRSFADARSEVKRLAKQRREDAAEAQRTALAAMEALEAAEKQRRDKERADEAKERKAARERLKKAKRRAEKALWAIVHTARGRVDDALDDALFEDLCQTLDPEELVALAEVSDASAAFQRELRNTLDEKKRRKATGDQAKLVFSADDDSTREKKAPPNNHVDSNNCSSSFSKNHHRPWSDEELSMLAKSIKRFPAGARQRWDGIADYLSTQLKLETPRTKDECISKYHEIHSTPQQAKTSETQTTTTTPATKDEWTAEQQQQLELGLAKYPASLETNERWKRIASEVAGKSKKECVERFKFLRKQLQAGKASKS